MKRKGWAIPSPSFYCMLLKTLAHAHGLPHKISKNIFDTDTARRDSAIWYTTIYLSPNNLVRCGCLLSVSFSFISVYPFLAHCVKISFGFNKTRVCIYTIYVCMLGLVEMFNASKACKLDMGFKIYYVNADCAKNDVEMNCFSVELQRTKVQCDCIESDNGLLFGWADGSIVYLACNFLNFH